MRVFEGRVFRSAYQPPIPGDVVHLVLAVNEVRLLLPVEELVEPFRLPGVSHAGFAAAGALSAGHKHGRGGGGWRQRGCLDGGAPLGCRGDHHVAGQTGILLDGVCGDHEEQDAA